MKCNDIEYLLYFYAKFLAEQKNQKLKYLVLLCPNLKNIFFQCNKTLQVFHFRYSKQMATIFDMLIEFEIFCIYTLLCDTILFIKEYIV